MAIRIWAAQSSGGVARFIYKSKKWKTFDTDNGNIYADPTNRSSLYYVNSQGLVVHENFNTGDTTTYPALPNNIPITQVTVGLNGRLWAIGTVAENGNQNILYRLGMDFKTWDMYSEHPADISADWCNITSCYYVDENGLVVWRNADKNITIQYTGIEALKVSVSFGNPPFAIDSNQNLRQWNPATEEWNLYSKVQCQSIFADPVCVFKCYFVDMDGAVSWYDIRKDEIHSIQKNQLTTKQVSIGNIWP